MARKVVTRSNSSFFYSCIYNVRTVNNKLRSYLKHLFQSTSHIDITHLHSFKIAPNLLSLNISLRRYYLNKIVVTAF